MMKPPIEKLPGTLQPENNGNFPSSNFADSQYSAQNSFTPSSESAASRETEKMLRRQLLSQHGFRPGSYLSRSQDDLSEPSDSRHPKSGRETDRSKHHGQTSSSTGVRGDPNCRLPKVSSTTAISPGRGPKSVTSPVRENPSNLPGKINGSNTRSSQRSSASTQADARISKTKTTVTELQKSKVELESRLSELTRTVDLKQAEIAKMKMHIRKLKEDESERFRKLRGEYESLKRGETNSTETRKTMMTLNLEEIKGVAAGELCDASTSPLPQRKGLALAGGSEEGAAEESDEATGKDAEWDRQSTSSQLSEISVACLQDRIVQMEETHYSTSEELQATLQELTDLQDIVDDLNKENQQLAEERQNFAEHMYAQSRKIDQYRMQIENLKHLLLSGMERRTIPNSSRRGEPERTESPPPSQDPHLLELLRMSHDEQEELKCKYLEAREELSSARKEGLEWKEMLAMLRDRTRLLESQIEGLTRDKGTTGEKLLEAENRRDKDRRELIRLTNLFEKERCRVEELQRHMEASCEGDLAQLLENARREKNVAEEKCSQLQEILNAQKSDLERQREVAEDWARELRTSEDGAKELRERLRRLEEDASSGKNALSSLEKTSSEWEAKCAQLTDDKKELMSNISTLQAHLNEVVGAKDRAVSELAEIQRAKVEEEEEWKQFQSDLQVAVVVANDFKMEAQSDIERLSEENSHLRNRISSLTKELERARTAPELLEPSPSTVKNRAEDYVRSATRSSSVTPTGRKSMRGSATQSVKALINSLENPAGPSRLSPFVTLRETPLRSRCSPRGGSPHSVGSWSAHSTGENISKSSTNLITSPNQRPLSAEGFGQFVKAARSESELVNAGLGTSARARAESAEAQREPIPPDTPEPSISSSTPTNESGQKPKGILAKKAPSPSAAAAAAQRKVVYLDPENRDPLAKLMKDAPRGSRRNALLKWCQSRLNGYPGVEVTNFSSSWNDGLAFCALFHSYDPSLPFHQLDSKDKRRNFESAFGMGESVGIPSSLRVDEMLSLERPDWQAVMSYVTDVYKHYEL